MCCNVEVEGKDLEVTNEKESWGTADVFDGKKKIKVKYRVVLVGAQKTKTGEYVFRSITIFNHDNPQRCDNRLLRKMR